MKLFAQFSVLVILLNTGCLSDQVPSLDRRKKCTTRELQKCMSFLQIVTEGKDTALPANRNELKRTCSDLKTGLKCLDKHSGMCFSQEQALVFDDLVTPAKGFISQLCDNGRTEAEFLKYASCYRNISLDADKCAVQYGVAITASSNATESVNPEMSIKLSCCSLRKFIQCKYDHVGRDCGHEAEHFMRNHLGLIMHPLLERHCAAYTYGSHACAEVMDRSTASKNNANSTDFSVFIMSIICSLVYSFVAGEKSSGTKL